MKLYYVYDSRSPFMVQDLTMLQRDHQVRPFDLSEHITSYQQAPAFAAASALEYKQIQAADALIVWFADYTAIPFMTLAKAAGVPVIIIVGGWEVYGDKELGYGNQTAPLRGAATRMVIRNANAVISPSEAYAKIIREVVPGANVSVVPLAAPYELFKQPVDKYRVAVTAYCRTSTEKLKGIDTFREAAKLSRYPTRVLKGLSHDHLISELRAAKVYCQLSYTESFGMTVLEAMACGCVPVVTDRDALPEVVGNTGVVVPYGDIRATTEAITEAMEMSGEPARRRAMEFSTEKRATELNKIIGKVKRK